jgi:hypothetical protein
MITINISKKLDLTLYPDVGSADRLLAKRVGHAPSGTRFGKLCV